MIQLNAVMLHSFSIMDDVHTEQHDNCVPCIVKHVREMMQDRGYKEEMSPPTPLPSLVDFGLLFQSDGQTETTDMQHDLYGMSHQQQAVVLFIQQKVSIIVAREMLAYRQEHDIDRLIVVITSSLAKATSQVNTEFISSDVELFLGAELSINRNRNKLVPKMRVLSPAEAVKISTRERGGMTTFDKQYRYFRPPIGSVFEIISNNGQTQPKVKYREVK